MKEYTILPAIGVKSDFERFNVCQNKYHSEEYIPKRPPPKKLIKSAILEFEEFCKEYHIDSNKYSFIEPCEIEGDWRQFDFLDSDGENPARIVVSDIISDKNGKIYGRAISI